MTGDVGSVNAAIAAGKTILEESGTLVNAVVLSRPLPEVFREVV
jgi:microcompartment protein CcmL/EutN